MSQEVLNIIFSAIGVILTGLASWGVTVLTTWLNSKIKDKQLAGYASQILSIISDAVKQVYQEFVEVLKANGKFDEQAQLEAKNRALEIITTNLTTDLKKFIEENYGDMLKWVGNQIEVVLYNLKNK